MEDHDDPSHKDGRTSRRNSERSVPFMPATDSLTAVLKPVVLALILISVSEL